MNKKPIDFVITWVDGTDTKWMAEREKYISGVQEDSSDRRYRDWDNLRYWFRGVEKFAPWVNRVFFVTCGQIPGWLNVDHPKLRVINHSDYIPEKYLPLFNSNPIEIMLNRIENLSEQFVLFNDDTFLIKKTAEEDFFDAGLPCDSAALNIHSVVLGKTDLYASLQATGLVNKYFDMHKSIRDNLSKWINPKYGKALFRTIYLLPSKVFPEIRQFHLPNSFLKSVFDEVWEKEPDLFYDTCTHRFRNKTDYTQWSMRNWQIASGRFVPRKVSVGQEFTIGKGDHEPEECVQYMRRSKGKIICMNDGQLSEEEFAHAKKVILDEFERMFPEKSSYEK